MDLEKRMTCREMEERLILNYYGELEPGEVREVEQHLVSCAGCTRSWNSLKGILDRVGGDATPSLSDDFWKTFSKEIRDRIDSRGMGEERWRATWPLLKPVPLFATLVMVG